MKVIPNSLIPFPGFLAVNLFGLVFVRRKEWDTMPAAIQRLTLQHEAIHTAQLLELWVLPFYIIYLSEWFGHLLTDPRHAYRRISFEEEAYAHEMDPDYLNNRQKFAQWKH